MATTPTPKRVRKVKPAPTAIVRDTDGNVVIPISTRRKMDEMLKLNEEKDQLEAKLAELKADVLTYVDATGEPTLSYGNAKFTRVQSTSTSIDEDELKDLIGSAKFNTITKRVIDKKLLDVAIQNKKVSLDVIVSVTTEKKNKPYLKVTKS